MELNMAPAKTVKSIRLRMTCPAKIHSEPVIHRLSHDCKVVPNILRGRITEKKAWLEVELTGPQENIEKALRFLARRRIAVRKIEG